MRPIEEKVAYADMRKKLLESLKRVFRPEFINRLDSVIVFRALSREDIHQIVNLELEQGCRAAGRKVKSS